ncbi:MAG: nuclear transport factor 2 family protein [Myxococcales bacterium]|nr:nuclear transport factor 2 family protein [Myxococcales bacterium]
MRLLHVCAFLALGSAVAAADPTEDVAKRLETLTSKSTRARADVPRFAFTSNVTWEAPNSLEEAMFGLPALTLLDKAKTVVGFADPDTAFVVTHLAEFSSCPAAGCAKATPESWLRATAVFEKTGGIWQPLAWAITPPIPGDAQVAAMSDGIVPDKLGRDVTGADAVALLFETTMGNPKLLANTVSTRKETVLLGSELSERYTGAQVKAQLTSWNLVFKVRDGVRAGVSKSGKLAWVAANVDAGQPKRPKAKPIPYRVFAIYELTGTEWKLVQLQFSTAV